MKHALIASLFISFSLAPHVFAQTQGNFVPLAGIPGLTEGVTADSSGLSIFFNNLYKYLIGLAATLAVIMIVWAGIRIAFNQDNVSVITDSKGRIYNAIFGLVLVLSPVLVFSIINPSILNLSVNLPKLDTTTTPLSGGGTTNPPPTTVDPATGCSVTGSTYLKTAVCSPQGTSDAKAVAKTWLSNNCSTSFFGLFGADSSPVTCTLSNSAGCAQASVSCEGASPTSYLLINIGPKSGLLSITTANMEPFDAQTSSSLSQFISGCNADNGYVCTNQSTALISGTSCPSYSTLLPGTASKKCFKQTYYCFNSADATQANAVLSKITSISGFLSLNNSYICQPNLQFTVQPLQ